MNDKHSSGENAVLDGAIRKSRRRLVPFLVLMYLLAFVDRANVGFAKAVLQQDIHVGDAAYAFGASLFFFTYAAFEVPSNLLLHRFGARRWLSRIMFTWGIVAACTAFARGTTTFYALRFLLGAAEAGFFPGIILYLTLWFPSHFRARATGMFYFGLPLALIFGGPLSGFLLDSASPLGLRPWQFMFFTEGAMASGVGIVAYFYLTDSPRHANWLDAAEQEALSVAVEGEEAAKVSHGPQSMLAVVGDPKVLMFCLVYFTIQVSVYGVVFYLPSRIAAFFGGHVGTSVGILTTIPWLVAILATYASTRFADASGTHRQWAAAMLALAAAGISASTVAGSAWLVILAFCIAASGFVGVQPLFWTLPSSYLGGAAAAGGLALINALGNLGGFAAPNLEAWTIRITHRENAGMLCLAAAGMAGSLLLMLLKDSAPNKATPTAN